MTKREVIEILKSEQVVALGAINNITTTDAKRSFVRLKHEALGVAISALQEPERKHGEWMGTVCSCCGGSTVDYYDCDFCPKCGAIMDGKEKEND